MPQVGDTIYYQFVTSRGWESRWRDLRWQKAQIVGETSRSWLIDGYPEKLPKNGKVATGEFAGCGYRYAPAEIAEKDMWDYTNRERITKLLGDTSAVDTDMLRKVADLLGYKELQ